MHRRAFLQTGIAATTMGLGSQQPSPAQTKVKSLRNPICIFTDHLDDDNFTYPQIAAHLKQLGVAGPDLTVRPGGLVRPERVTEELPKVAAALRDQGLSIPMISTGITSIKDPLARPTLAAMKKLGIRYYKLGYYPFGDSADWQSRLTAVRKDLEGLAKLNEEMGVQAGFHNHSGATVGGALWDSWEIMRDLDAKSVGFYFDPSHATIEGGNHGWKLNFARVSPRLKMVAIKDYLWEKVGGAWRSRWVPLGEGMVRWPEFCALLLRASFDGPISLHIEYDPGGSTPAARLEKSLEAASRDLKFFRQQLDKAAGTATNS
jgi:L-ribulose-5-phosphate 3-epimerase